MNDYICSKINEGDVYFIIMNTVIHLDNVKEYLVLEFGDIYASEMIGDKDLLNYVYINYVKPFNSNKAMVMY